MHFNPDALKKARNDAGLTLEALAEKSGVGVTTIHYLESGRSKQPNTSTIGKLAVALQKDWSIFFTPENQKIDKKQAKRTPTPAA